MKREMIASGIRYIGDIPTGWNIVPGKSMFDEVSRKNVDGAVTTALKFTYGEIVQKENFDATEEYVADTIRSYNVVASSDVVVNGLNLNYDFVSQRVAIVRQKGVITSAYVVLRPKSHINPRYLNYHLKACDHMKVFHGMGEGIRQTIKFDDLGNMSLLCPNRETQDGIARYLDSKCSAIDEAIERKRSIIERLKEYRIAIITKVVTKGLSQNVKIKDSGISWIGKIPFDWKVIRTKYCFTVNHGSDPKTESGNTPVYGSGNNSFKTCKEFKVGPAVLVGRKGTINSPRWIEGNYWNVDTSFDVQPKGNYELKLYYYASMCFDYEAVATQTALPSMTQSDYLNFRLPLMNADTQKQIVDYLDTKCNKIDSAIRQQEQLIAKLEEYRKSVIYYAVTGKIDCGATVN